MFSMNSPTDKPMKKTLLSTSRIKGNESFSNNNKNQSLNELVGSQSPKLAGGKVRPGTSMGVFSRSDINEKFVNFKGVNINSTYEKETMYTLYGEFLKRPTHTFTDFREEEKKIKQARAQSSVRPLAAKQKNINDKLFPLDGGYFKTYNNEYQALLTETQKESYRTKIAKKAIQKRCEQSNVLASDRLGAYTQTSFYPSKKFNMQKDYHESDIFNFNERISKDKTSEFYTIPEKRNVPKPYTVSNVSNSAWKALNAHPNLINHGSTGYHLLNPGMKNLTKTKKEIMDYEAFNPIHRQKMLSEYTDITRVGGPNPGHEFRKIHTQNKFLFNRTADLCTKTLDNHAKNYKDICLKPFLDKNKSKIVVSNT